jgi:hypothetical protein
LSLHTMRPFGDPVLLTPLTGIEVCLVMRAPGRKRGAG